MSFIIGADVDQTMIPVQHKYNRATWMCGVIVTEALGDNTICPSQLMEMREVIDTDLMKEMEFDPKRFPLSWKMTYEKLAKERRLKFSPAVAERLLRAARTFRDGPYPPYPGVADALHTIRRRGHRVVAITAGRRAESLQWHKMRESGLLELVDDVKITPEDKTSKMIEVFGDRIADGLMVGDSLKHDIVPAKKLGVRTVLVPTSTWKYTDADVKPDFVIKSFTKLPQLLTQLARHS